MAMGNLVQEILRTFFQYYEITEIDQNLIKRFYIILNININVMQKKQLKFT